MDQDPLEPYGYEVDLRDYISIIWRHKWLILLIVVIAVGATYGYSALQPDTYETHATLLITPRVSEQLINQQGDGMKVSLRAACP